MLQHFGVRALAVAQHWWQGTLISSSVRRTSTFQTGNCGPARQPKDQCNVCGRNHRSDQRPNNTTQDKHQTGISVVWHLREWKNKEKRFSEGTMAERVSFNFCPSYLYQQAKRRIWIVWNVISELFLQLLEEFGMHMNNEQFNELCSRLSFHNGLMTYVGFVDSFEDPRHSGEEFRPKATFTLQHRETTFSGCDGNLFLDSAQKRFRRSLQLILLLQAQWNNCRRNLITPWIGSVVKSLVWPLLKWKRNCAPSWGIILRSSPISWLPD